MWLKNLQMTVVQSTAPFGPAARSIIAEGAEQGLTLPMFLGKVRHLGEVISDV